VVALGGSRGAGPDEVFRHAPWSSGTWASVGKEAWRHLRDPRAAALLLPGARCRRWVLSGPASFLPTRPAEAASLVARRVESGASGLPVLARAMVSLLRGDIEGARVDVAPQADPWLAAAATFLAARRAAREEDGDTLRALVEAPGLPGLAGRALSARLGAVDALHRRATDTGRARRDAARLAGRLEADGDLAGLASALNVRGVLDRRLGELAESREAHTRAASIALLTGDAYLVQAALLNLAAVLGELGDAEADAHLDAALWLADTLGLGHDSAQAECLAALRALDRGNEHAVWRWVSAALRVVTVLATDWEQAYFLYTRGRVASAWPRAGVDARRDRRAARRLFLLVGDETSAESARRATRG
jgi:tetratricopeptide (TPR) repeat protein